jgi:hypothetical protein
MSAEQVMDFFSGSGIFDFNLSTYTDAAYVVQNEPPGIFPPVPGNGIKHL